MKNDLTHVCIVLFLFVSVTVLQIFENSCSLFSPFYTVVQPYHSMNASDTPPAAVINAAVGVNYPADSVIVSDNQEQVLLTNTLSPLHESGTERANQNRVIPSAPNELEHIVESINPEGVIMPALDNASPYKKYYEDQTKTLPK